MLTAVLSGFALSILAPFIHRMDRNRSGWIFALLPLALFAYFCSFIGEVANGNTLLIDYAWLPSLDVYLSFYLDGLSLLFALIISGIGAVVISYAGAYLAGHRDQGRFYCYILAFMASMLGVVLSNNMISLFVFWELTSLSSYLLIGYYHDRPESRAAALQSLLVTGLGAFTMVLGAGLAILQIDLKRLLAYSTVSALGMLVMLLGVGTTAAAAAAMALLLAHALYKERFSLSRLRRDRSRNRHPRRIARPRAGLDRRPILRTRLGDPDAVGCLGCSPF